MYPLEHFYYGQLVREGKPQGEARLLSKTAGVTEEQAAEAMRHAMLPPVSGVPGGAWALVRSKVVPFIMVQSQLGKAGQLIMHFIIMPPEVLRGMSGNLTAMLPLVKDELPVYEKVGERLVPLTIAPSGPPSKDALIDDLLDLMTYTNNRIATIESALSAIVQGVQVVVTGAPAELKPRVDFIEGLLALLPPSARFGVTFATHSDAAKPLDTQIRFLDAGAPPAGTLVYDWATREVSGHEVPDDYGHYIVSQLRLDTELVIQQTEALTAVAAWRIKRGERLAEAMAYASYRLKVDNALLNNQPVEIADVSNVLAEDPTLSDDLRMAYARHLMSFSLALGDTQHADPVAPLLNDHHDLADLTLQQMTEAARNGKAGVIYETLVRWMALPQGPHETQWIKLAHAAALTHLQSLIQAYDLNGIHEFLNTALSASPAAEIRRIVPRIIEMLVPLLSHDPGLAERLFLLGITYLDIEALKQFLNLEPLFTRLPTQLAALVSSLTGGEAEFAPRGLLMTAARAFDPEWQSSVVLRLAELAKNEKRYDLLDSVTLGNLLQTALSPKASEYAGALRTIVRGIEPAALASMDDLSARYILQILLALGDYRDLARGMIIQARERYPGDLQSNYLVMTQRLFAETPLPPEQYPYVLQMISDEGIRAVPLIMASVGALEASAWSPDLLKVAQDVTDTLFDNRSYLEVIHPDAMTALLNYHVQRKDVTNTIRVASLIPEVAAHQDSDGLKVITQMYKLMAWENRVQLAALELLRRYVRKAEDQAARQAVIYFSRELGAEVRQSLETTYYISRFMGGVEITDYAGFVHIAADFLQDTASAYVDKGKMPTVGGLLGHLEPLYTALPHDARRALAEDIWALGRAIVALGKQHRANRQKNIDGLLAGKADPQSAIDIFRAMGGYFTKGKRVSIKLEPVSNPFGKRNGPTLKDDIAIAADMLTVAAAAFPLDKPVKLTAKHLRAELDSLWGDVPTERQREIVRDLALDLQRIADLAQQIAESGDPKAMDTGNLGQKLETGRHRPKSALEFYRFLHSYFRARG